MNRFYFVHFLFVYRLLLCVGVWGKINILPLNFIFIVLVEDSVYYFYYIFRFFLPILLYICRSMTSTDTLFSHVIECTSPSILFIIKFVCVWVESRHCYDDNVDDDEMMMILLKNEKKCNKYKASSFISSQLRCFHLNKLFHVFYCVVEV